MAVDEAMARAVGEGRAPPTLRFYTWIVPTVSLGYLQRVPGGVDQEACRRQGIPLVRRPTGGRAVLHAGELTYSVAIPLDGLWRRLSVPEAFALVSRGLIAGLRRLGVEAAVGEAGTESSEGRASGVCFLMRRMPAVLVGGRKLIGSAQRRWERSVLQHGSLLLEFDPVLHQAVFPAWPRAHPTTGVTCLRALLGKLPPITHLVDSLAAGWREVFTTPCASGELSLAEHREARDLTRLRYGSAAWTFQR